MVNGQTVSGDTCLSVFVWAKLTDMYRRYWSKTIVFHFTFSVTMVAKASSPATPPAPPPTTPTTPTSQNADYFMSPTFTVRTPKADIVVQ